MRNGLNKVQISGEVTRDVELRYTPRGQAVASFKLRIHPSKEGGKNGRPFQDLVPIIAYGKAAEDSRNYLKKGSRLLVEGRLQSRSFTTVEGERKNVLEVVAKKITQQ